MAAGGARPSHRYPFMHSMSIDRDEQSLRDMIGYGRNVLGRGAIGQKQRLSIRAGSGYGPKRCKSLNIQSFTCVSSCGRF
jgi:hypothetical protein